MTKHGKSIQLVGESALLQGTIGPRNGHFQDEGIGTFKNLRWTFAMFGMCSLNKRSSMCESNKLLKDVVFFSCTNVVIQTGG